MSLAAPSRRTLLKGAAAGLAAFALPQWARAEGFEAVGGAAALGARRVLQSLPAAVEGSGEPIWILSSSRCGYCRKMDSERPGPVAGIETRYVAWPLADAESGAVAKVWRDPASQTYRRFMSGAFAKVPAVPVPRPGNRSQYYATPDARLTDAQLFDKWYAEIIAVKSLWANAQGRIEFVTPESFLFLTPPEGLALLRLPGDGVPVLQELMKEYPGWFGKAG